MLAFPDVNPVDGDCSIETLFVYYIVHTHIDFSCLFSEKG